MNDELWKLGDEVIITIPEDSRSWGYNPCPDGTKATITGFNEMFLGRIQNYGRKPGVYENRCWIILRMPDGKEHSEFSTRLKLTDFEEERKRSEAWLKQLPNNPLPKDNFLRDLPETPFWEGDFIKVRDHRWRGKRLQITTIDYQYLTTLTDIGTKYPAYQFSDSLYACWTCTANEDEITLIERGPVWKYYHHEPIEFASIKDEGDLHHFLSLYDEVKNPANNLYKWTLEEVLEAIKNDVVHCFTVSNIFGVKSISALRFHDENLGQRLTKATLEDFFHSKM